MAEYTSWDSLTDRTFDGRHLPPRPAVNVPEVGVAAELFRRGTTMRECPKSTLLFASFAQWFTDGFLRSDRTEPRDPRKNTSTHEIDLCQLYGLNPSVTRLLRTGHDGLLKSQHIGNEEYPQFLCKNGVPKDEFTGLSVLKFELCPPGNRDELFAIGGDRGNSQIGYAMMNVLFFREHNRVARLLAKEYRDWDDEQIFQTARMIVMVVLIKIVICEYINHISPFHFTFSLNTGSLAKMTWFRQNWMAVEFNLLYRWHSLVPSVICAGNRKLAIEETLFNNRIVLERGLGPLFEDFSNQAAGRIGLLNTADWLLQFEQMSIEQGRQVELATYNDYREHCGFPRVTHVDQISGDPEVQRALQAKYASVDDIEFYVGLFAEDRKVDSALPPMIGRMVGIDAFSQALTNPLLAPRVFNKETFSPLGWDIINQPNTLSDVVHRNITGTQKYFVSMTRGDWQRGEKNVSKSSPS